MIYLDTNAFYFFFFWDRRFSPGIKKFFAKMQLGKEKGVTNAITLDELAYVTLMRLLERKYKKHPASVLRERPSVVVEFTPQVEKMFDVIFSMKNLEVQELSVETIRLIPILMRRYLLLPADCIHVQTMREARCTAILSTDPDFDKVSWIKRIRPEEIK